MKLIDTHTHLNSKELYKDRKLLIKKAISLGVKKMIVVGYDLVSSKKALKLAHEFEGIVYAAIGIHPSETIKAEYDDMKNLEELIKDPLVVAVGEIGYDFHFDDVPELIQKDYFIRQIKLADKYAKPIIVHMRDATEKTLQLFEETKTYLNRSGIIHCYSGSKESVKEFMKYDFYISFGGPLTFLNSKTPKEAIKEVPLNRLLFETDCPYLSPHPFRGQLNEPSNIILVLKEASKLLSISEEELSNIEYANAEAFINLCK